MKKMVSSLLIVTIVIFTLSFTTCIIAAQENTGNITSEFSAQEKFSDVPDNHWSYEYIYKLRDLGITNGIGNNKFGLGMTISRGEFVTFLVRLMKWDLINPEVGSFKDNLDKNKWYYQYIETAVSKNIILKEENAEFFRPEDKITREEMAVMIVRALGFDNLARQILNLESPFTDVERNSGHITIAKDMGIIRGVVQNNGETKFLPDNNATREEAAAMMIRMYDKLSKPLKELHAFYAIRSYPQKDYIKDLSSVSFGWSRLEYDESSRQVILNTSSKNNNVFSIPTGYQEPIEIARENNIPTQLMVFLKNDIITIGSINNEPGNEINNIANDESKLHMDSEPNNEENSKEKEEDNVENLTTTASLILTNKNIRSSVINMILNELKGSIEFDGVVIDFENMSGDTLRNAFNEFLFELKAELKKYDKSLWVAVHPKRAPGQDYYDAYDYKSIGDIADKVILMAHDYSAKQLTKEETDTGYNITPLTPIKEVYFALKSITDEKDGVRDPGKVLLQISFDSAQWKLKEGKVEKNVPLRPDYEAIIQRLLKEGTEIFYSKIDENPYAKFFDPSDGTDNIIWYEDSRSVEWKIKLATLFDIGGISIWRLGNIPNYRDSVSDYKNNTLSNEAGKNSELNDTSNSVSSSKPKLYMDVWDTITTLVPRD